MILPSVVISSLTGSNLERFTPHSRETLYTGSIHRSNLFLAPVTPKTMYTTSYGSLLTTVFALLIVRGLAINSITQQPLSSSLSIRNATISDTEAITNIMSAAFDDSPPFRYIYQFMDKYPKDYHDCRYEIIHAALGIPGILAEVALLPNNSYPHEPTPIAVALWVPPAAWNMTDSPSLGMLKQMKCSNRYMNTTRFADYLHQLFDAKEKYLDSVYAHENQLYLDTLATHPDYQRRGAGSALVRSGVQFGKDVYKGENVTATLIATEAGEPLYQYLQWTSLRNFTVRSLDVVDGSREEWKYDVMKYEL